MPFVMCSLSTSEMQEWLCASVVATAPQLIAPITAIDTVTSDHDLINGLLEKDLNKAYHPISQDKTVDPFVSMFAYRDYTGTCREPCGNAQDQRQYIQMCLDQTRRAER
jgi:hypothetical protein